MAMSAGMSCPSSCARARAAPSSFARRASSARARPAAVPAAQAPDPGPVSDAEQEFEFDVERIVARQQGREGWTRDARRQLDQRRWENPDRVPRAREDRLVLAGERLEAERDGQVAANRAYEDYRANGRDTQGRRPSGHPKPWVAPELPEGVVSVSDPDSQRMKANNGYVQGYNAQAVVDEGQIVLAAEITNTPGDFSNLDPMITAAIAELEQAGVTDRPEVALADAQYWNEQHMDEVIAEKHIQLLVRPDSSGRKAPRPGWTGGRYSWMRTVLSAEHGKGLYRKRMQMIEPVFGHTKHNRLITRFHRRGRAAVRTEWRLRWQPTTSPSSTATNSRPREPKHVPPRSHHPNSPRNPEPPTSAGTVARQPLAETGLVAPLLLSPAGRPEREP